MKRTEFFMSILVKRYELSVADHAPDEKDFQASQIIMKNIARLLPLHLRGEYA
jgi:hypothetical protein